MWAALTIADRDACSVPLNGDVTDVTVPDVAMVLPSSLMTNSFAELLKALAHAESVAQVGWDATVPLAGLNDRCPGFLPTAACAVPGTSIAAPTVVATIPSSTPARLSLGLVRFIELLASHFFQLRRAICAPRC